MENKKLRFTLKSVSEKTVLKAMKSLKPKKSGGPDGISQEQVVLGSETLAVPLTRIIIKLIVTRFRNLFPCINRCVKLILI